MINRSTFNVPFIPSYRPSLDIDIRTNTRPLMRHRPEASGKASSDARETQLQQFACDFIASATGVKAGQTIDMKQIHRYLSQQSTAYVAVPDSGWGNHILDNTACKKWAETIKQKNAMVMCQGSPAWADALMREIFPERLPQLPSLPQVIYAACIHTVLEALDQALVAGVDYVTLDQFCDRILSQFLFDAFLLPRLCPNPSCFPEPRPTMRDVRKDLAAAFESHAAASLSRVKKDIKRLLEPEKMAQLERLCKERKVMVLLGENAPDVDTLGGLKQDFIDDAVDTLGYSLGDPAYILCCLLEVYFSYPARVHQDVFSLQSKSRTRTDPRFENKYAEFQVQKSKWQEDLAYLTNHFSAIEKLSDHGKEYFLRMLQVLSQASYRPSRRTLTIKSMLATARSLADVIAEEPEPAQ